MRLTRAGERFSNADVINGWVEIDAPDVIFTNTEAGRVIGGIRMLQGGTAIVNDEGGIIRVMNGADQYSTAAIVGSSADDTVINNGLIGGLVQLGAGADRYVKGGSGYDSYMQVDLGADDDVFENANDANSFSVNGGNGRDRVILSFSNQQASYGTNLIGFEDLTISGDGQFVGFSGYQTITLGIPGQYGLSLIQSLNPTVDVALAGNRLRLTASSLRSVVGSDAADGLELSGASAVSSLIDLGGGNDRLTLSRYSTSESFPVLPASGAIGGSGYDTFEVTTYSADSLSIDASKLTGFEALQLNYNFVARTAYAVSNANGFKDIGLGSEVSLALTGSSSPEANLSGGFGGSITLDRTSTINRYGFPIGSFFDQRTDIPQADDRLSVRFTNQGVVSGDLLFYIGDDVYDGSSGFVGGIVYGNAGNDILIGNDNNDSFEGGYGADKLYGNAGADLLRGGPGSDLLDGGAGLDTMLGGPGNDTFYVDAAGDSVMEVPGEGEDRLIVSVSYALGAGVAIEMLTTSSAVGMSSINLVGNELSNTLIGNAGSNILNGGDGPDTLVALAGNDVLIGGNGKANALQGGLGDDSYFVTAAGDSVIEFAGEGIDTVRTDIAVYGLGGNIENLIYLGISSFIGRGDDGGNLILGGPGSDILDGFAGDDILVGGLGDDVLIGGAGANTLQGGGGNDIYYVSSAGDTIIEEIDGGYDTIFTSLSAYTSSGAAEALVYTGQGVFRGTGATGNDLIAGASGDDALSGLGGNDILSGNGGADTISGGAGADQINGGAGNDRLTGGDGADIFVIADSGQDIITDFEAGSDRVYLDGALFAALSGGQLVSSAFARGSTSLSAGHRIIYNPDSGALIYDADGSGAGAAVQFALISVPIGTLSYADFFVV